MKRIAMFPGSFDPFTAGHLNILKRALTMFDEVVVAVGINGDKRGFFPNDKRIEIIEQATAGLAGEFSSKKTVRRPAQPQKPKGTTVTGTKKPGRNEPCPCGSGKKYKNCCGANPGMDQ